MKTVIFILFSFSIFCSEYDNLALDLLKEEMLGKRAEVNERCLNSMNSITSIKTYKEIPEEKESETVFVDSFKKISIDKIWNIRDNIFKVTFNYLKDSDFFLMIVHKNKKKIKKYGKASFLSYPEKIYLHKKCF